MADIDIQRKQGTPAPWLIAGVALLALLLWFLFARGDGRDVTRKLSSGTLADSLADSAARNDTNPVLIGDSVALPIPDPARSPR